MDIVFGVRFHVSIGGILGGDKTRGMRIILRGNSRTLLTRGELAEVEHAHVLE
jgi:hypothetical protein